RLGELAAPIQRRVEVGSRDDREPAEVLLTLGEWAVRDEYVAAGGPQHGGGAWSVQSTGEHPRAGGLHLRPPVIQDPRDLLQHLGRGRSSLGLVHAEQVLLHCLPPLTLPPASGRVSSSTRTAPGRIDNARAPARAPAGEMPPRRSQSARRRSPARRSGHTPALPPSTPPP